MEQETNGSPIMMVICNDKGFSEIYKSLMANIVVIRTSSFSVLAALKAAGTERPIILLTSGSPLAELARKRYERAQGRAVYPLLHILKTGGAAQSVGALIAYRPGQEVEENLEEMESAANSILVGSILPTSKKSKYLSIYGDEGSLPLTFEEAVVALVAEVTKGKEEGMLTLYLDMAKIGKKADAVTAAIVVDLERKYESLEIEVIPCEQKDTVAIVSLE